MNKIIVFTDGACANNGKQNAKAGCGVFYPNKEYENISLKFTIAPITNQRAELYAIYLALISIKKEQEIWLYTDSLYSIKCLTQWIKIWKNNNMIGTNGKPVKNQDILLKIDDILKTKKVSFFHVNSHVNNDTVLNYEVNEKNINEFKYICNNIVDKLATNSINHHQ